jgi:nucleotidyltransferase substrate binding protein (TIGR01987 family)
MMTDERNERIARDVRRLGDALKRLKEALGEPEASSKSWDDTSQAFEYTMDLFWKLVKEMLASRGIDTHMPREAVQASYERGWIEDPSLWIEMLKDEYELSGSNLNRNTVQHLYPRIRSYYPELLRIHERMVERLAEL